MQKAPAVEVKVVYSAAGRRRRSPLTRVGRPHARPAKLAVFGLVSAAVTLAMYYATWWQADPELRAMVFLHTPLVGLDFDGVSNLMSKAIAPDSAPAVSGTTSVGASEDATAAQWRSAAHFVITILGWEALSTISILALALLAGGLIARSDASSLRRAAVTAGLLALALIALAIVLLWTRYGRVEPKQIRAYVGALAVVFGLIGLIFRRGGSRLGRLAAFATILAAAASAYALHVLVEFGALESEHLPLDLLPCMVAVFVAHSLWGWILLLLAPRVER